MCTLGSCHKAAEVHCQLAEKTECNEFWLLRNLTQCPWLLNWHTLKKHKNTQTEQTNRKPPAQLWSKKSRRGYREGQMIDCESCSPGKLTGLWDLKRKKVNAEFVRMSLTPQKRVLFLHQQRAMAQSLRFSAHFPFLFFPVHLFQADYIVILDTSLQMLNKIQEFKITICRI